VDIQRNARKRICPRYLFSNLYSRNTKNLRKAASHRRRSTPYGKALQPLVMRSQSSFYSVLCPVFCCGPYSYSLPFSLRLGYVNIYAPTAFFAVASTALASVLASSLIVSVMLLFFRELLYSVIRVTCTAPTHIKPKLMAARLVQTMLASR
jgi:hypothetical protein